MKKSIIALCVGVCVLAAGCAKSEPKAEANTADAAKAAAPSLKESPMLAVSEQPAPKGFKIDSTTQKALDADAKAKELFAKVKTIEESGKVMEKKAEAVAAYMEFANYMTFKAPVSPRIKYRPALKAYNRVLELQADNAEAAKNKKMIEDIYQQMGLPVPKD